MIVGAFAHQSIEDLLCCIWLLISPQVNASNTKAAFHSTMYADLRGEPYLVLLQSSVFALRGTGGKASSNSSSSSSSSLSSRMCQEGQAFPAELQDGTALPNTVTVLPSGCRTPAPSSSMLVLFMPSATPAPKLLAKTAKKAGLA